MALRLSVHFSGLDFKPEVSSIWSTRYWNVVMDKRKQTLEEKKASINEAYDKKIAQIDAQLKDISAREKEAERKRDTRRKIIMGGLAGFHMEKNPRSSFAKKLAALIDEYVIGDKERALFDLETLPKTEAETRRIKHREERKNID